MSAAHLNKKELTFIADFFVEDIPGGGELNNEEFMDILRLHGFSVRKIHSVETSKVLKAIDETFCIIGNFVQLSQKCISLLTLKQNYLIYEHDHKYLRSRNPALYPGFTAPKNKLVNVDFYRKAVAVLCQSSFHKDILYKNLKINNLINLSGNLWSQDILEFIEKLSQRPKTKDLCAIMDSKIPHKNTEGAIKFCMESGYGFQLIPPLPYRQFLLKLSKFKRFVFLPKTPETLSRVVVEAKLLDLEVILCDNVGASKERWFEFSKDELFDYISSLRVKIPGVVEGLVENYINHR